jgi:hypothetical protein
MIYMEPMQLGWSPLVESWLQTSKDIPENVTADQKNIIKVSSPRDIHIISEEPHLGYPRVSLPPVGPGSFCPWN